MDLFPALQTGSLLVVYAPQAARQASAALAARLALRGPVSVLDGGNRFTPYAVTYWLRRETADLAAAAERLTIQRAFTCYQMLALLEDTPCLPHPHLVLDFLDTFYDDHVPTREAIRLLEACLRQVNRLRRTAPVAVTLAPPLVPERATLVEQVCDRADHLLTLEPPSPSASQLPLF